MRQLLHNRHSRLKSCSGLVSKVRHSLLTDSSKEFVEVLQLPLRCYRASGVEAAPTHEAVNFRFLSAPGTHLSLLSSFGFAGRAGSYCFRA